MDVVQHGNVVQPQDVMLFTVHLGSNLSYGHYTLRLPVLRKNL